MPNFDRKLRSSPWFVLGLESTPGTSVQAPMRLPEFPKPHPWAQADPRIWMLPGGDLARVLDVIEAQDERRWKW